MRRVIISLTVVAATLLLASGVAFAAITPTNNAASIANAIARDTDYVTGANFVTVPPEGTPNAVSTTPLAGFPTNGVDYGILTTGDARLADEPNGPDELGEDNLGGNFRGDTDYDVSILKINLSVPNEMNCLTIDFRFLSEEYPEYVNTEYNYTFIAELDTSNWTTSGSTISAPNNFAFDENGEEITINSTGDTSMKPAYASGTSYNAATARLQSRMPITPGAHSLYLSIFDQGDNVLDSAVFVDNLRLITQADDCTQGAIITDEEPPIIKKVSPTGKIKDRTPLIKAVVKDGNTNLTKGNMTLKFDGKNVSKSKFSYSNNGDVLKYKPGKIALGKHTVKITAKDAAGNVGTKSWSFRIIRR